MAGQSTTRGFELGDHSIKKDWLLMINRKAFGKKIEEFRKAKGWSVEELSAHSGFRLDELNKIEIGEVSPSRIALSILSDALDVGIDELYKAMS